MAADKTKRPLTVEDIWAVRRVGMPDATADGSVIVTPVSSFSMEDNKGTSRLYRLDLKGGDPVPLTAEGNSSSSPALDHDGTRVVFVRSQPDGPAQIAILPLNGGEAEILTDFPLGVADPRFLPDGHRIVFVGFLYADAPTLEGTRARKKERDEDPVKAHITEDRVYRFWDEWLTDGKVPHLFVMDLRTRAVTDLIPDSTRWFDFMDHSGRYGISPDGTEIAFSANASAPPHDQLNWDIFTVPVDGGEVVNLTQQNPCDDLQPRYSPDGRFIVYGMQRDPKNYADRVRLVAYDREQRTHTVLTEDWDRSAGTWVFTRDNELALLAEDNGRSALYRMAVTPGEPELVLHGGTFGGLLPLDDGSFLVARQDMSTPTEVHRVHGASSTPITHFNDALMSEVALGEVRDISVAGSDGKPVQAWVVLPPGFDDSRKWPLVNVIHGGPHGITGDLFHFRWNLQLMASPGYVVVAPNFHGSTSWGQEFTNSIHGGWGDKPYRDVMAATDHLINEGYIDSTRMAAAGGSYGGYLVGWIAGQTDRFACLVNHAGVNDLLAEYASDVTQGRDLAMGGEPWDRIEPMDAMNPVRFASGFKSPMLVIHGEKDYRVPVTQGLAMYNIYKAKGVPARLVYFPDENHWVLKPRNAQLWYREFFAWLDRWFKKSGS